MSLNQRIVDADVRGTNSSLSFDRNADGQAEMLLNSTGLGIFSLQPTSTLDVEGNVIISSTLSVGHSDVSQSNLQIAGSLGFSSTTVASNIQMDAQSSVVFLDNTRGRLTVSLPDASQCSGRLIELKALSNAHEITLQGIVSPLDGEHLWVLNEGSQLSHLSILSSGNQWYIFSENQVSSEPLLAWFNFDQSSGSNLTDVTGHHTGTLLNMDDSDWIAGLQGQALDFDGINDKAQVLHTTYLGDRTTDSFSISIWSKPNVDMEGLNSPAQSPYRLLEKESSYWITNSGIIVRSNATLYQVNFGPSLKSGQWYHMALTFDGQVLSAYLNGLFRGSISVGAPIDNVNDKLYIGNDSGTTYNFNGIIDDLRIYDNALSAIKIKHLYEDLTPNQALLTLDEDLLLHLTCDETSGSEIFDSGRYIAKVNVAGIALPGASVAGNVGTALDFDGTTSELSVSTSQFIVPRDNAPLSVSMWINADTIDANTYANRIFQVRKSNISSAFLIAVGSSNKINVFRSVGGTGFLVPFANTISTGVWYHIAVTFDGTNWTYYLNGNVDTPAFAGSLNAGNNIYQTSIGHGLSSDHYDGKLDDVRVYQKALTEVEVQALFQLGQ